MSDCPFCPARNNSFVVVFEEETESRLRRMIGKCPQCRELAIFHIEGLRPFVPSAKYGDRGIPGRDGPADSMLTIQAVWPRRPSPSVPDHLPDAIASKLFEAERCYVAGAPSGACALYRATMERALRAMYPDDTGTLNKRIRRAEAERRLPQAMIDWLDEVKAFGNDAAHGDYDATQQDAEAARDFINVFLTYTYTMPERVKLARKKREGAKAY